jgi:hypothetical protein
VASVSGKFTFSAQQTFDDTVSKTFNTSTETVFNTATAIGFDNQVLYTEKRFNLYSYPVIGRCVACADENGASTCPTADPNSSRPAGQRPLHLIFPGPDEITMTNTSGSTLE